jgi:hypothetical protein
VERDRACAAARVTVYFCGTLKGTVLKFVSRTGNHVTAFRSKLHASPVTVFNSNTPLASDSLLGVNATTCQVPIPRVCVVTAFVLHEEPASRMQSAIPIGGQ